MADLTITEANVIPASDAQLDNSLKSAAALAMGKIVYKTTAGLAELADCDDETAAKASVWGMTVSKTTAAGQPVTVLRKGKCAFGEIIDVGQIYVLSDTPGGIKPSDDLGGSTGEVQTVDLSGDDDPTGGTWELTILGETLEGIAWNVTAAALEDLIQALDVDGAEDVTVGKVGFVYTITFPGSLGNVAAVTADSTGLTGGGGDTFAITINTGTPGLLADRVSILGIGVSDTEIEFRIWNTGTQLA